MTHKQQHCFTDFIFTMVLLIYFLVDFLFIFSLKQKWQQAAVFGGSFFLFFFQKQQQEETKSHSSADTNNW